MPNTKLTSAQAEAARMIEDGWRIKTINTHYKSGGTQIWVRGDETRTASGDKALVGYLRKKYGYFFSQNPDYKKENYFSK